MHNNFVRIAAMCAVLAALASLPAAAGWPDRLPVGKDALVVKSAAGDIRIDPLAENLAVRKTKRKSERVNASCRSDCKFLKN